MNFKFHEKQLHHYKLKRKINKEFKKILLKFNQEKGSLIRIVGATIKNIRENYNCLIEIDSIRIIIVRGTFLNNNSTISILNNIIN